MLQALRPSQVRFVLEPALAGGVLGLGATALVRLGLLEPLSYRASSATGWLFEAIGPVWIPMALALLRVGWLGVRAARTRLGRGRLGEPVRPELAQIAPVFAALGLCGTVWGLSRAFEALNGGDFLTELPLLLGGLGAAMTSTLVGLALQIATLGLGLVNPAWSWLEVRVEAGTTYFTLDRRALGAGDAGFAAAVDAVRARLPEALCVAVAREVPERSALSARLWRELDSGVPVREVDRPRGGR